MKHEWKRLEKEIYMPKNKPEIIKVPKFKFFTLEGEGNPNSEEFSEAIGVLYSLSYCIKMMPKKGKTPQGYFDYTVYPLEGIWDLKEEAKAKGIMDKDSLVYKIMIRQPDFVTTELAEEALKIVKKSKPHRLLDKAAFEIIEDGQCVQMLHVGSYDTEPESFAKMEEFCVENKLVRESKTHREIYLSDARRTEPEKLNTVLRFKVEKVKL
jgi:hypothetical protein